MVKRLESPSLVLLYETTSPSASEAVRVVIVVSPSLIVKLESLLKTGALLPRLKLQ